ncbi:hydroxylysine kinase [Fopius arisanus]|uniref:Hydroxylysine kinase n=1 Tax=Fopius arisanus TaxID=64838 RepID=A0A9R1SZJ8_9HYME|nr:PREDICTED: hydroxylysine kinase [Fopius arisanus]XP_011299931.1 PREDICTED: hydroxylysine kinase [Fopius arisanus]
MDNVNVEKRKRPEVSMKVAIEIVRKLYGFKVKSLKELNGYDDKNLRITCCQGFENPHVKSIESDGYVLKIMNSMDSRNVSLVEGQNEMMLYLHQNSISCPIPVMNLEGSYYSLEDFGEGTQNKNLVRLLVYCPGEILYNVKPSSNLLRDVGRISADLDEKLRGFSHPSFQTREFIWMLVATPKLRDYTYAVKNEEDRLLVEKVIARFERDILGDLEYFEMGLIHGDLNEQNLIVNSTHDKIATVIDFGDSHHSCLIFELIITLCYMIIQVRDIESGRHVVEGYVSVRKISELERKILKTGVCARLCQSLVLGAYSHLENPNNDYVMITAQNGWAILRELWPMEEEKVLKLWGL